MGYYMAGDYYTAGDVTLARSHEYGGTVPGALPSPTIAGVGAGSYGAVAKELLKKYGPGAAAALGLSAAGAGAAGGGSIFGIPGAAGKRYRRMNPLNPRALRRSMRRVQSFAKFARRTMQFTKTHRMKKGRKR